MYKPSSDLSLIISILQFFDKKYDKSFSSSLTKAAIAPDFFPYTSLMTSPTLVLAGNSCTASPHSTLIILIA